MFVFMSLFLMAFKWPAICVLMDFVVLFNVCQTVKPCQLLGTSQTYNRAHTHTHTLTHTHTHAHTHAHIHTHTHAHTHTYTHAHTHTHMHTHRGNPKYAPSFCAQTQTYKYESLRVPWMQK